MVIQNPAQVDLRDFTNFLFYFFIVLKNEKCTHYSIDKKKFIRTIISITQRNAF